LAVFGEGGPDEPSQAQFDEALKDNTLVPVRSLSGGFSEDPAKADISYTQSYSLVKFLIEQHGQDKMLELLRALRDGGTVDEALQQIYGFDIEGFEDAWRADIGAQPRSGSEARPTPTLVPTIVPTFVPASISITGPTPAPTRERPTPTPIVIAQAGDNAEPTATAAVVEEVPPQSLLPAVLIMCGVIIFITAVAALIVGRRKQRMDV
jgi:hypothetical protein